MDPQHLTECDSVDRLSVLFSTGRAGLTGLKLTDSSLPAIHPLTAASLHHPRTCVPAWYKGDTVAFSAKGTPGDRFADTEGDKSRCSTPSSSSSANSLSMSLLLADDEEYAEDRQGSESGEGSFPSPPIGESKAVLGELIQLDEDVKTGKKQELGPFLLRQGRLLQPLSLGRSVEHAGLETDSDRRNQAQSCDADDDGDAESRSGDGNDDYGSVASGLDTVILAALDGNISLAVAVTPSVHQLLHNVARHKVDSWQIKAAEPADAGDSTTTHGNPSGSGSATRESQKTQGQASKSQKKRRRSSDSGNGREDGEDGHDGNGHGGANVAGFPEEAEELMMACPFHKKDPIKYGIQHSPFASGRRTKYRSCAGPGFRSIQRLKEHLKRIHSPAQCDRCYMIFQDSNKATPENMLADHRQQAEPCPRGDPALKEGISEEQWKILEQYSKQKNQEAHKLEKWRAIYQVIFPESPDLPSPLYEAAVPRTKRELQIADADDFVGYFQSHLAVKVSTGEVSFADRSVEDVQRQMESLVRSTLYMFTGLNSEDNASDGAGSQAAVTGPASGTSAHGVPEPVPRPHTPPSSKSPPPQQPQPVLSEGASSSPPVDGAVTMSPGGSITNGVRGISITDSMVSSQQQQAGTSSSQQSRLLRPLAPAPVRQLPQPQVQTRPLHAAGGSHYGHSEQGAHALQGLDHQGQNWQHSPHLNSMGYSEQDAANYYRVPWQVDHTAHQSNVSRHYDPAATIAQHTMGTDYNTSHDGYAAAPHHDYHPH